MTLNRNLELQGIERERQKAPGRVNMSASIKEYIVFILLISLKDLKCKPLGGIIKDIAVTTIEPGWG